MSHYHIHPSLTMQEVPPAQPYNKPMSLTGHILMMWHMQKNRIYHDPTPFTRQLLTSEKVENTFLTFLHKVKKSEKKYKKVFSTFPDKVHSTIKCNYPTTCFNCITTKKLAVRHYAINNRCPLKQNMCYLLGAQPSQ